MKDIKDIINLDNLLNYVGFANTPTYLYKHYIHEDSIANLSKEYTTEELKKTFMFHIDRDILSLEDYTILYACIFALMLKPLDEAYDLMKAIQYAPIRWADKLSNIYFSNVNFEIEQEKVLENSDSPVYEKSINSTDIF